jgi:hypothetical protein
MVSLNLSARQERFLMIFPMKQFFSSIVSMEISVMLRLQQSDAADTQLT